MKEREIYTPKLEEVPPMPELRTLWQRLGEEKIRELVSCFYDIIQNSSIAPMFPGNWDQAKKDQADFMIQVLGGPSFYSDRKGHPRMRMRHFAFEINEASRLVWLNSYRRAMEDTNIPSEEKKILDSYLDNFSKWMINSKS
ncbi:globin domain-containing protein [Leptospira sp. GIMC2001]|uniref:globin domain-containing protein n=1 Tax=Leptospira sp. GIMC2001 TaxID=1513297 RepID=UPI00234B7935|nr:bacitracin resistance protein BacA [Leptospira sp. GIMC2001]WCL49438.1 bacitracin resistance protein BacA [Leptospira sp. GIMC2001]